MTFTVTIQQLHWLQQWHMNRDGGRFLGTLTGQHQTEQPKKQTYRMFKKWSLLYIYTPLKHIKITLGNKCHAFFQSPFCYGECTSNYKVAEKSMPYDHKW